MVRQFDTLPTLDIKMLRRAGLFRRYEIVVTLRHKHDFEITFDHDNNSMEVIILSKDEPRRICINCTYTENNFGRKYYFVCPILGKTTEKLYLCNGWFASRSGIHGLSVRNGSPSQRQFLHFFGLIARLQGTDGKGPARGEKRLAILDELRSNRLTMTHYPEIAAEVERAAQGQVKKLLRQKSWTKYGPFSTSSGLKATYEPPSEILVRGIPELDQNVSPVLPDLRPDAIWLHPAVDLPTLLADMAKAGTELGTFHMVWQSAEPACFATIVVDIRYGYRPGISARITAGGLQETRSAHIVKAANGRRRLVCPYTGKACDTLYIRGGLLGSREALLLKYPHYAKEERLRRRSPQEEEELARLIEEMRANHEGVRREDEERALTADRVRGALLRKALAGDGPSQRTYLTLFGAWGAESEKFSCPEVVRVTRRGRRTIQA